MIVDELERIINSTIGLKKHFEIVERIYSNFDFYIKLEKEELEFLLRIWIGEG